MGRLRWLAVAPEGEHQHLFDSPDLGELVVDAATLQTRVAELGAEITRDYEGRAPLLIGVPYGRCISLTTGLEAVEYALTVARFPDRTVATASEWEYGGFSITGGPGVSVEDLLSLASGLRQR